MSKKIPVQKGADAVENRQKDYVTNKLLIVFTLAFIVILALMFIGRRMRSADIYYTAVFHSMAVVAWVFVGLMALGIIYAIVCKARGKDMRYHLLSGVNIAVVCGFLALCFGALAVAYTPETLNLLYVVIPAVTILYILYYSFPRDYFVIAATAGVGSIGAWLLGRALNGGPGQSKVLFIAVVLFALLALVIALVAVCQAKGGRLGRFEVFAKDAKYWLIYLTAVIVAAVFAALLLIGGAFVYYFVFGLIAYIIVVGVVYLAKQI